MSLLLRISKETSVNQYIFKYTLLQLTFSHKWVLPRALIQEPFKMVSLPCFLKYRYFQEISYRQHYNLQAHQG